MTGTHNNDPKILLRRATLRDMPRCADILHQAVEWMLANGKQQWNEEYPNEIHLLADINASTGYVLEIGGKVMAYGAVVLSGEPAYSHIDGEWLTDTDNYVVVHRLAVLRSACGMGIGARFLKAVEHMAASQGVKSFRIDTNFDNHAMLHLLEKCGFDYCGEISYATGSRMAFEKLI